METKRKYQIILIASIIILIITLSLIGIVAKIKEPTNENENIINNENNNEDEEKEDDIIKVIIDEPENNENTEPTETPTPTEEPKENNLNGEVNVSNKEKYYIKINNLANTVTIYTKDTKGEYTKPVKAMICSIGTATPETGVFKISDKYDWRLLQGNVYGQYSVRITGHILFHSVPYEKKSKDALEWWEYDKLGTKASLGCIRLTVEDAKWIYDNCEKGTQVEFYSDENPGPLGKPTAKKISGYDESLKKWDLTDPDVNNPWRNYVEDSKDDKLVNAKPTELPKENIATPTPTVTATPTSTPIPTTVITPTMEAEKEPTPSSDETTIESTPTVSKEETIKTKIEDK